MAFLSPLGDLLAVGGTAAVATAQITAAKFFHLVILRILFR